MSTVVIKLVSMKLIALLRGINVAGKRKISMPELRDVVINAGFSDVKTYINSGNIILHTQDIDPSEVVSLLETSILNHFGFPVDVIIRTEQEWRRHVSENPFPEATKSRPNFLHLGFAKLPCDPKAASLLSQRKNELEQVTVINEGIWVDFATGPSKSKITPAVFEKAVGSPVTMRNWRTVQKINEMLND